MAIHVIEFLTEVFKWLNDFASIYTVKFAGDYVFKFYQKVVSWSKIEISISLYVVEIFAIKVIMFC